MKVRNYMTEHVVTVHQDRQLLIAGEMMEWASCRHVPVVDDRDQLVGLVTHSDLLRASLSEMEAGSTAVERRQYLSKLKIRDVMVAHVACIDPDATINAAAGLMRRHKYGCLPVVDTRNQVLGILTEHDLLSILEHIDLTTAPTA